MTPNYADARRAAWSAYWARGGLHSCTGSFAGNYDGAIGGFWRGVFGGLPGGPLRLLDLATGNGAIPQLALQALGDRAGLQLDAVDLAELAPAWVETGAASPVVFHPGVAMEALPFADGSFDLVSSQFGFEYAGREAALAEALRVLRPGGRLALVMHHAGSVLVRVARAEAGHQAALLAPGGLLDAAGAVLPWLSLARRGGDPGQHAEAVQARQAYNQAMSAAAATIGTAEAPDLLVEVRTRLHQVLAGVGIDPVPDLQHIADLRAELEAASLRTQELVDAALSESDAQALDTLIERSRPGLSLRRTELRQAEGLLAWGLEAWSG